MSHAVHVRWAADGLSTDRFFSLQIHFMSITKITLIQQCMRTAPLHLQSSEAAVPVHSTGSD